ncbi:hypothetical protein Q2941_02160 [Bradyrhizobium sp. UFLA05-153]
MPLTIAIIVDVICRSATVATVLPVSPPLRILFSRSLPPSEKPTSTSSMNVDTGRLLEAG